MQQMLVVAAYHIMSCQYIGRHYHIITQRLGSSAAEAGMKPDTDNAAIGRHRIIELSYNIQTYTTLVNIALPGCIVPSPR